MELNVIWPFSGALSVEYDLIEESRGIDAHQDLLQIFAPLNRILVRPGRIEHVSGGGGRRRTWTICL
jgi:hypothetical protein